jgi:hypothetical protein
MKFFVDLTVLTTHTQTNPLVSTFKIDKGVIQEIGIFYPSGCHGLVYAKVFFQAHQILPRNQESWCHGNNGWWSESASIEVTDSPLKVKVIAWALDTLFDHTITVCIELSPFSYVPKWDGVMEKLDELTELLGTESPASTEEEK